MRVLATIILLGLMSCHEKRSTTVRVEKYNHDKLMDTLPFEVIKAIDQAKTSVVFQGQLTDTVYYFLVASDNKNEIEFMGHKSELIARKAFEIDGENVEVLKYKI